MRTITPETGTETPAKHRNGLSHAANGGARFSMDSTPVPTGFIRRAIRNEHICVLTFDRPGSSSNIFDRETLIELREHLLVIAAQSRIKGLILASAKPSIFIAGADLKSM